MGLPPYGVFVMTIVFAVVLVVVASLMPTRVVPPTDDLAEAAGAQAATAS